MMSSEDVSKEIFLVGRMNRFRTPCKGASPPLSRGNLAGGGSPLADPLTPFFVSQISCLKKPASFQCNSFLTYKVDIL